MQISQQQLNAIMADYTKQHSAMMARSAANVKAFHEGRPQPFTSAQGYGTWNISDRD
jgi:hypothetical protein